MRSLKKELIDGKIIAGPDRPGYNREKILDRIRHTHLSPDDLRAVSYTHLRAHET